MVVQVQVAVGELLISPDADYRLASRDSTVERLTLDGRQLDRCFGSAEPMYFRSDLEPED